PSASNKPRGTPAVMAMAETATVVATPVRRSNNIDAVSIAEPLEQRADGVAPRLQILAQSVVTGRVGTAQVTRHGIGRSPGSIGLFGKASKLILSHCVCSCFIDPLDFCCARNAFRKSTTLLFPFCTAHAAYDFSPTRLPKSNTSGFPPN